MVRLGMMLAAAIVLAGVGAVSAKAPAGAGLSPLSDSGGHIDLWHTVRYVFGGKDFNAFKPYIRELLSPGGVNPLRDNVADHIHHHALMYAVAVDGVDFWSETRNCGRQEPRTTRGMRDIIEDSIDWVKADGKTVAAIEKRTICFHKGVSARVTLLSWRTQLSPPAGAESIKLTGSHYFGLGMRFVKSMDNASTFTFADPNAKGLKVRGDEKLTPSVWAACTGKVDGKTVTVAMFDHPENPRPALWFTMGKPFSYLSATINLWKEPMVIKAGEELDVCYGIAVWDEKATREQIDAAYGRWKKLAPALKPAAKPKQQAKDKSE